MLLKKDRNGRTYSLPSVSHYYCHVSYYFSTCLLDLCLQLGISLPYDFLVQSAMKALAIAVHDSNH